jgi:hypothetical protein
MANVHVALLRVLDDTETQARAPWFGLGGLQHGHIQTTQTNIHPSSYRLCVYLLLVVLISCGDVSKMFFFI